MARPKADRPTFSLTKRGAAYYIQFWWDGAAKRVSTRTDNPEFAADALADYAANFDPAKQLSEQKRLLPPPRLLARSVTRYGMPVVVPAAHTLKSEKDLAEDQQTLPWSSGVYFLFEDDEIVYVGQAVNVLRRIGSHVESKRFTGWSWVPVPEHDLLVVERAYIMKFKPRYNLTHADPVSETRAA